MPQGEHGPEGPHLDMLGRTAPNVENYFESWFFF
jgi:hypothetical protein